MPHYVHIIHQIVSLISTVSDIPRGSWKTTPIDIIGHIVFEYFVTDNLQ